MLASLTYGKTSHFDALPPVVVVKILEHLRLRDRVVFARCSQRLRKIALSRLELWTKVTDSRALDTPDRLAYKAALLRRSWPAPARLEINADIVEGAPYAALVETNMSRLTSLRMSLRGPWGLGSPLSVHGIMIVARPNRLSGRDEWRPISDALRNPAPLLEDLDIFVHNNADWKSEAVLAPDILGRTPGHLRNCSLTSVALPFPACRAFSQLTSFCYEPHNRGISDGEVYAILSAMPCLETLGLCVGVFIPDPARRPQPVHPCLRNVALRAATYNSVELVELFKQHCVTHLVLDHMRIRPAQPFHGGPIPPWAAQLAGTELARLFPEHNRLYVGLYQAAYECDEPATFPSRVRFSASNALATEFLTSSDTFANLTCLTIHESAWARRGPLPSAPRLTHLAICLASCFDYIAATLGSWVEPVSGMLQATPEELSWSLPLLREVFVVSLPQFRGGCRTVPPFFRQKRRVCDCDKVCSISLAEIYRCLRGALHFDRLRLEHLVFGGIQHFVDADLAESVVALYEWAENVDFLPEDPDFVEVENLAWQSAVNPAFTPRLHELFKSNSKVSLNPHVLV
ncbi:hypothetical protein AURDEDRAFT_188937 [Auricularia subglabra TFB-10046 SS5]|uniref:F-box domain-containing protein n=1 Tax=Auricularia subglabra (strain TFB-10046 / SS5) TaxID=717982 RepID=J0LDP1_AURST|nr:hypothetical protein AURDEDRAFT_188937 [Auricularia subglabra TFB-10046 SS5]